MDRWATFDCYGTLIDWNGGIGRQLERVFGAENASHLLHRYHELEHAVQREQPTAPYREVLDVTLARLAASEGLELPADEGDALSRSLPKWKAFPEVRGSLQDARARGWKLAILSNTDRDYIEASLKTIGVPFELAIVAGGDRLVQAGPPPLGDVLRANGRRTGRTRPRRRRACSTTLRRPASSGSGRSGSTGSARSRSRSPTSSFTPSTGSGRPWTDSSPGSLPA